MQFTELDFKAIKRFNNVTYNFKRHFAKASVHIAKTLTEDFGRNIPDEKLQIKRATADDINQVKEWQEQENKYDTQFNWGKLFEQDEFINKTLGLTHRHIFSITANDTLCGVTHFGVKDGFFGIAQYEANPNPHPLKGALLYVIFETALQTARGLGCHTVVDMGPFYNPVGEQLCRDLGFNPQYRESADGDYNDYYLDMAEAPEHFDSVHFQRKKSGVNALQR